ncbi:hypothetical protein HG15A2_02040 [Adhaeretor mobilis]|uniref:Uncharacterized protein n=1 Tax=Adhaeretor mobilis TaxID=1930276 RepID=A0A517MPY2_9BACT|nr:hypothetical protein HG15A2_02040 [Adhaeretor mobilis]
MSVEPHSTLRAATQYAQYYWKPSACRWLALFHLQITLTNCSQTHESGQLLLPSATHSGSPLD